MTDALSAMAGAWAAIHDATPAGWYVASRATHTERREWVHHAFDTRERPKVGVRSRKRTAVANSEVGVLQEMARCLRELGGGRVPR